MLKTIKFYLVCDNKPIRTIEDLRDNFAVEDVLDYYNTKMLHRWLKVRKYDSEYEAVTTITSNEPIEIIKQLINIFKITTDQEDIDEIINHYKDVEERKKQRESMKDIHYNSINIVEDDKNTYENLIEEIIKFKNDKSVIIKNIQELVEDYDWIIKDSYKHLFYTLMEYKNYLAILCLIMNENTRHYYLSTPEDYNNFKAKHQKNALYPILEKKYYDEKREFLGTINTMIKDPDFLKILGNNVEYVKGTDSSDWVKLEERNKRCLIIKMGSEECVRPVGETETKIYNNDVVNLYPIIDGLEYKSSKSKHNIPFLVYMVE